MGDTSDQAAMFRTVWRWHFYAGLIVAPFLLILSVTGAIYLFDDELNDALQSELRFVEPTSSPLPASQLIASALAAHPGSATRIDMPASANRSAIVFITPEQGASVRVFVDPANGTVLGNLVYTETLVGFADIMHGSLLMGRWGDALVELAACWSLLLIASGIYLWWPRSRNRVQGVVIPRLNKTGRLFWRDLHAVTGVWAALLIAFLVITGLPWAGIQGPLIRTGVSALGLGNPALAPGASPPVSALEKRLPDAPWGMQEAPLPSSGPEHQMHAGHTPSANAQSLSDQQQAITGVDRIVLAAQSLGLYGGYRLHLPATQDGVYSVLMYPDRPQGQRAIHFDRYSAQQLQEVSWADYGVGARAIEIGTQIHMGRYFGRLNQFIMLMTCIAIITLVVAGIAMWWKRRPPGTFSAPPQGQGIFPRGLIIIITVFACLLPVMGLSLLIIVIGERVLLPIFFRKSSV